jgi:DNA-binding PadR family transcriptional regulator
MPNFFTIIIKVEELALGPCVRRINDMPGVVDFKLDLGEGGLGAGRKQLEDAARTNNGSSEQIAIKLLMQGPQHTGDISRAVGGAKSRAYGVIHQLKKKGLIEPGVDKGHYQLTTLARAQIGGALALPAPEKPVKTAKVKHGPKGRATPGSGNIVLRELLNDGAKSPIELRKLMSDKGMSPKSISGVLARAKDASLIKKNGTGYELTAKGLKIEVPAAEVAANG